MTFGSLHLFGVPIHKISLPNWDDLKPQLLEMIDLDKDEHKHNTCTTDFFDIGSSKSHPYLEKWWKLIETPLEYAWQSVGLPQHSDYTDFQLWTQRYHRGNYHSLHNHGFGSISGVLHLEFNPEVHLSTTLQCPYLNPLYGRVSMTQLPDVQEGDIVLFPSAICHEALPNESDEQRTIMSFNIPLTHSVHQSD
jgi:hypothetical protein